MSTTPLRLLFLSMDWYRTKDPRTPLAMASIQAYYEEHRQEAVLSNFISYDLADDQFNIDHVISSIRTYQPDLIAWGTYIWNESQTQAIIQALIEHKIPAKVILGGPQITFAGNELDKTYPRVDYFVKGSGEEPFVWLIDQLAMGSSPDCDKMRKLCIYSREMIASEDCRGIHTAALDSLGSPYLSGTIPIVQSQPFVRWETMRGCPYRCNFCQFRSEGVKPTLVPSQRLMQELEHFHAMNVQEIHVLDPIFNLNPQHYLPILEKIQALGMKAKLYLQCRLELLLKAHGEQFLAFCKDHGNVLLEFGVQTFNQMESDAVKRGNRYPEIDRALGILQERKIPFDLHLIFGLPHQTMKAFSRSYEMATAARPQGLYLYPLNLLKGTELEISAHEGGYAWDQNNYNELTQSNWMSATEVEALKAFARRVNALAKLREAEVVYPPLGRIGDRYEAVRLGIGQQ
jgi:radical SAM superfamily enzyme YgiQ (UPF0313 family)